MHELTRKQINNCKNCGTPIKNFNFCPNCGAKKITRRITFKNLCLEFSNSFLNFDNSFFRTFTHLFTKPEQVIDGYINGLRKRYLNAISYFAISLTLIGIYSFFLKDRLGELLILNATSEEQLEITKSTTDLTVKYQSLTNFLIIPILALISRLVFINYKKYNLTEHLIIYLYAYSHIVAIMSIVLFPIPFITDNMYLATMIQFPIYIIYIAYVLKRLYNISFMKITLKTILFLVISTIIFTIFTFMIAAIFYKFEIIEIPSK
ncbi:DUF3667 domain-containing protein [Aquimarina algicola]|uniref:DUF3667 domain-containing protein n=1 Tax=Aquimarina algicola TaxID=2589995 RepID=A0A504IYI9_9FLAO|nr:DUF3667 domain-containing protein [Aquimarina algicola]TPN81262.1 DUF3667 domain-containing protein [Aquimarina algicola]